MSYLYNVYSHPQRGQWGFTALTAQGDVKTAFVDARDARVTLATLDPLRVGPALQKNVRAGFQKVAQPKYLHLTRKDGAQVGAFVSQHPDLGQALPGERLFFVAVPDKTSMAELVAGWRVRLEESERAPTIREQWLAHCENATVYVPVMSDDAHAALLVAQWAKDHNLVLVTSKGEVPRAGPGEQRHDWRRFLNQWIALQDIDSALADLGWPLSEALGPVAPVQTSTTPERQDAWIALAQQVSF